MTIYKSFTEELLDEQIKDLGGLITIASWERVKPHLEKVIQLKEDETIKGIVVDEFGIKFYLNTIK